MHTTRSSSCQLCVETPLGVGLETPTGSGPEDPMGVGLDTHTPGVGLKTTQVWAWRPPPGVGLEIPPARPLKLPHGCGPGNLQGMLGYTPSLLETFKACWDTTCKACWDTTLPVDRQTRVKT